MSRPEKAGLPGVGVVNSPEREPETQSEPSRSGAEEPRETSSGGPRGRSLERESHSRDGSQRGADPPPPTAVGKTRGVATEAAPGLPRGSAGLFSSRQQTFHRDASQSEMRTPENTG